MKTELLYLTLVTALTGLLWLPYILDRVATRGLLDAVGYPENPKPQSPWAVRLMRAHDNAVENLVVFAALVLVANAAGVSNSAIATAGRPSSPKMPAPNWPWKARLCTVISDGTPTALP